MRTPPNERVSSDIVDASRPSKSEPERRCILSGETHPRASLLRLAISPDGLVLPDPNAKAPGRGSWLGVDRRALEDALAKGQLKGALARAFKGAALSIPDDLTERIQAALQRNLTDRLGLEMRSGQVVLGSQRIAEQARQGRVALLMHASDSSEDGRKKLDQAWRVGCDKEGTGARGIVLPLDRAALSVALGRENVVHLGIGEAAAALRVQQALARLLNYLGSEEPIEIDGVSQDSGIAGRHELNA
ncbi:DUF448 domain-containing protein [Altererythrobacter lutimaris]|uniref:DUF448 domain-containing protein n=1 Tax=Altererythrobacter lutimaris TaxID=2743979 RepID=A0A850H786_9SPHN|nr:DUF448 domain-containing protein [Altererythrobacter lutimaris]NVE93420.1 DUF448 domain-containing protein [Altererythrobacter lutimaris]